MTARRIQNKGAARRRALPASVKYAGHDARDAGQAPLRRRVTLTPVTYTNGALWHLSQ